MNAPSREQIAHLAQTHGFADLGVSGVDLGADEARLLDWLAAGHHGDMDYMQRHGTLRSRPAELQPGTVRVISLRMDYWPAEARDPEAVLADPVAFIAGQVLQRLLRGREETIVKHLDLLGEWWGTFPQMPQCQLCRPRPY